MKILILIAVTILAVGCGGKDESTTEIKPIEEKVLEVKEEVKPEEPVAEAKPELEGVSVEEIEPREGLAYVKGSDTPYTGKVFRLFGNGQKEIEVNVKDGKPDGLSIFWHKNRQKLSEANWKEGEVVSQKDWDEEGELIHEELFPWDSFVNRSPHDDEQIQKLKGLFTTLYSLFGKDGKLPDGPLEKIVIADVGSDVLTRMKNPETGETRQVLYNLLTVFAPKYIILASPWVYGNQRWVIYGGGSAEQIDEERYQQEIQKDEVEMRPFK